MDATLDKISRSRLASAISFRQLCFNMRSCMSLSALHLLELSVFSLAAVAPSTQALTQYNVSLNSTSPYHLIRPNLLK